MIQEAHHVEQVQTRKTSQASSRQTDRIQDHRWDNVVNACTINQSISLAGQMKINYTTSDVKPTACWQLGTKCVLQVALSPDMGCNSIKDIPACQFEHTFVEFHLAQPPRLFFQEEWEGLSKLSGLYFNLICVRMCTFGTLEVVADETYACGQEDQENRG